MWNPTHIQFSVLRARNLVPKGKGGTNDVFVCIQLGKEKYQTSIIKHTQNPEWFEECDMPIPHMHSEISVTLYHRGVLSDDFLGHSALPLWEYKVHERPKNQWLHLGSKPGKPPDTKKRGEIEIKLTFHVKSTTDTLPPSLVHSKKRSSLRNIASVVGDKIKKGGKKEKHGDQTHEPFDRDMLRAQSRIPRSSSIPDNSLHLSGNRSSPGDSFSSRGSRDSKTKSLHVQDRWSQLDLPPYNNNQRRDSASSYDSSDVDAKPPIHDTSYINGLLRREAKTPDSAGSTRSGDRSQPDGATMKPTQNGDSSEIESSDPETKVPPIIKPAIRIVNNNSKEMPNFNNERRKLAPDGQEVVSHPPSNDLEQPTVRRRSKRDRARLYKMGGRRYTVQGFEMRSPGLYDTTDSTKPCSRKEVVPDDLIAVYNNMTKEELVRIVITHKAQLIRKDQYITDLETYIDDMLVRVIENTPKLLQNPNRNRRSSSMRR